MTDTDPGQPDDPQPAPTTADAPDTGASFAKTSTPEGAEADDPETGADDQPDDDLASLIGDPRVYEAMMRECAEDAEDDDGEPASAREARYRVRAREAEQRLGEAESFIAELQDQLSARDRTEAERLASTRLAGGNDLWAGGVQLDDLLDVDGRLDPRRVDEAVAKLLNRRPHWGAANPRRRGQLLSGASNQPEPRTSSWSAAFAPPSD